MVNIYLIYLRRIKMGQFKFTECDIEGMFIVEHQHMQLLRLLIIDVDLEKG